MFRLAIHGAFSTNCMPVQRLEAGKQGMETTKPASEPSSATQRARPAFLSLLLCQHQQPGHDRRPDRQT